jgi:hypothetical protein
MEEVVGADEEFPSRVLREEGGYYRDFLMRIGCED